MRVDVSVGGAAQLERKKRAKIDIIRYVHLISGPYLVILHSKSRCFSIHCNLCYIRFQEKA